ncbi:unnamed protein product [Adineta steineri]|uniref:Uncharacterized protein n=1 Tax=Adineta steineri TaxID=433720 RepID=A0A814JNK4_9BILA|nr:unnamed protein product [Adineta steineri]CAF3731175.1 unnamed protein product [Adineta steineri]
MYTVDIVNSIPPYKHQHHPYSIFYYWFNKFNTKNPDLLDARPFDKNLNEILNATHYLYLVIVFELSTMKLIIHI